MFRAKLALSLLLVFVASGAFVFVDLTEAATDTARARLEARLTAAREAVLTRRLLNRYAALDKARQVAAWPQIGRALVRTPASFAGEDGVAPGPDEVRYQIHRLINEEVAVWRARFDALATGRLAPSGALHDLRVTRPDFFAVVDPQGIGVAKAGDLAWFGPKDADLAAAHPPLAAHLADGQSFLDVWLINGAPVEIAVAPVRQGEQVVGGVVLGFSLTDSEAKADKARTGVDVAYFVGAQVSQSSSLGPGLERQVAAAVERERLHTPPSRGAQALEIDLGGHRHLVQVARVDGNPSAEAVGFLVLGDLDAALAAAQDPLDVVILASALGFVLCLGLLLVFFQQFVRPFERIDRGIMEQISGNRDHWFAGTGKDLPGTMAQNLNILVCILTGRPLPDEQGSQLADALERIDRASVEARPVAPPETD